MSFNKILCLTTLTLSLMAYVGSAACLVSFDRMGTSIEDLALIFWIHIGLVPVWFFIGKFWGKQPIPVCIASVVITALSLWILWAHWYYFSVPWLIAFPFVTLAAFYLIWGISAALFGTIKMAVYGP